MSAEPLIEWMTHRGKGRWTSFKGVVEAVYGSEPHAPKPYYISNTLSLMGVADFFAGGTAEWNVYAPIVGGLSTGRALLLGGRTQRLVETVARVCDELAIQLEISEFHWGVRRVLLVADSDAPLRSAAQQLGLTFVEGVAESLAREASPIANSLAEGVHQEVPMNWRAETYDLNSHSWVGGDVGLGAKRFTPARGVARYMVRTQEGLLEIERRTAIYAGAYVCSVPLLEYDSHSEVLSMPRSAPLPAKLARTAALCQGEPPRRVGDRVGFDGVRWPVATLLLALTGCPIPVSLCDV